MAKKFKLLTHNKAILIGFLSILPLVILNIIAGNQIEPFYTFFELSLGNIGENLLGFIAFIVSLIFVAVGAGINLKISFQKESSKSNFHILNFVVGLVLLLLVCLIVFVFTQEYYQCETLNIPNCD